MLMDWVLWMFLFVGFTYSLENAVPLLNGDFENYYELWTKDNSRTYVLCSTYQKPPKFALGYPTANDGYHNLMAFNSNYLIHYDLEAMMDILACDDNRGNDVANVRYTSNWPQDIPLKAFMFNSLVLINTTHFMDSMDLRRQNPGESNHEVLPLIRIETAIPNLTDDLKKQITECFKMNGREAVEPYCAFKMDENGKSTLNIVTYKYPILYHKQDVTVYYIPEKDNNHNVYLFDHKNNINYSVPRNLTTFDGDFANGKNLSVRIPLLSSSRLPNGKIISDRSGKV
ncbi:hypothetical protein M3Y95_00345900 [Aphelenchoides besseyi]|nr:hypothetical protein M3Y95_00345900 [Aphelenchoides besseyi]